MAPLFQFSARSRSIVARPKSRSSRAARRSPFILLLLLLAWSVILGLGLAQAHPAPGLWLAQTQTSPPTGTVDIVPEELQLGQELYLETCASCHVGIPPAVMPTDSWREILTQPNHYSTEVTPLLEPALQIVWNYVSTYSRPLKEDEPVPFRLRSSRFFKALHPRVEFPQPITVRTCITCHPAAEQFNYRDLTPEWQDAP